MGDELLQRMTPDAWRGLVAARGETLADRLVADVLRRFELLPRGLDPAEVTASVHHGDHAVHGDFTPSTLVSLIDGNLSVRGKVSTEEVGGMDGNATLIVFGDLRCGRLVNDWASLLIVTGSLIVDEWVFAAREDSSLVVGGDFHTPIFIGGDIWASVGGSAVIEYGYGHAIDLASLEDASTASPTHPRRGWRELVRKLDLSREQVLQEDDLIRTLEERLYATGSILRPAQV